MAFQSKKTFPELTHTKHKPTGEVPGHIKSSEGVGAGHCDSLNRMPDPNAEWTNEETGEGKGH